MGVWQRWRICDRTENKSRKRSHFADKEQKNKNCRAGDRKSELVEGKGRPFEQVGHIRNAESIVETQSQRKIIEGSVSGKWKILKVFLWGSLRNHKSRHWWNWCESIKLRSYKIDEIKESQKLSPLIYFK